MRKLKKWQRLGIVLSLFWILISLGRGLDQYEKIRRNSIDVYMNSCQVTKSFEVCFQEARDKTLPTNWTAIWIETIAPLILAWMLVTILIGAYRWIMRGE